MRYVIALGSNMRHHRHGAPRRVLRAAIGALAKAGLTLIAASNVIESRPLGPSQRRYANAAVQVETLIAPEALLVLLQKLEHDFGRRRRGQRWSARVLDLDLILWDQGAWHSSALVIPHPAWRSRRFVTRPLREVALHWRDPLSGLSVQQVDARLTRARPLPR